MFSRTYLDGSKFYARNSTSWTIVSIINIFGPSFFLASWITSQYFRVTRQAKVEDNLNTIEQRSKELLDSFELRTTILLGQISGGDSFCYIGIARSDTNISQAVISHQGVHPLYDLSVRIVDLDIFNKTHEDSDYSTKKHLSEKVITIGTLLPNHSFFIDGEFLIGEAESRSFNIFWSARNGFFTQLLRCKKINGVWVCAMKVERNGTLLEAISDDYPRDKAGGVEW